MLANNLTIKHIFFRFTFSKYILSNSTHFFLYIYICIYIYIYICVCVCVCVCVCDNVQKHYEKIPYKVMVLCVLKNTPYTIILLTNYRHKIKSMNSSKLMFFEQGLCSNDRNFLVLAGRLFASCLGDRGSIPDRIIQRNQKFYLIPLA